MRPEMSGIKSVIKESSSDSTAMIGMDCTLELMKKRIRKLNSYLLFRNQGYFRGQSTSEEQLVNCHNCPLDNCDWNVIVVCSV